jgi:hypothetical protein
MTVARKGHGEMRRTGAPRETPSCARLLLCSFPIFPHNPIFVARTHACHGRSVGDRLWTFSPCDITARFLGICPSLRNRRSKILRTP